MSYENVRNSVLSEISIGALVIPFLSCILGFAGTIVLIMRSQEAIGASPTQTVSAITSLCIAISLVGFVLTLRYRVPVILGWSTPGAALLIAYPSEGRYSEMVGAFVIAGIMIVAVGYVSILRRAISKIPSSISLAMLAGIVFPFCLPIFRNLSPHPFLIASTLITFIVIRNIKATYALPAAVFVAIMFGGITGAINISYSGSVFGTLRPTSPTFNLATSIELSIPIFLVTLTSQNLPGLLVLRSAGFKISERAAIVSVGFASIVISPFGGHGVGLASLTAAMCVGDESGLSKKSRWISGVLYSGFYAIIAAFCAPVLYFLSSMPREIVEAITAVAVIPILVSSIGNMMAAAEEREAAVLTFVATASGMFFAGIGAAFWGLVIGGVVLVAKRCLQ
ncbi:TPA: benzoate/H(+) symporter BenE family transporter [Burkholderia vietnamiensis]|uniref:benzoate/H(+) symporter BenE family transporter n=1 Tax=Burkholderia vietnamiensis TaxID=60552 RepID=UPI001B920342|nr:benzoate/H(+) symporter BenE family transporter [Burkholderia vietnamiensis]MBR8010426.1 benzoate/H(+) symporter BenE family transporter [Burkholderia vietnamiensis]HDR8993354.1 benzoate/H(+) symporter BenE family transporter [Burkholderia vietnamiensis]HDR9064057.1 benzoate/H(+) symporter BenE family transporter [Burkholderia vietnamiensis]